MMRDADQFKRGVVIEGRGSQVRVQFADNDDVPSPWLDVSQVSTRGAKFYTRPAVGSQVVCMMDANREAGVVTGALYSDADPAPVDNASTWHWEMDDGSLIIYEDGVFRIDHIGGVKFTMQGNDVNIDGNLTVTGNLNIMGDGTDVSGDLRTRGTLRVDGQTTLRDTTINGVHQAND